MQIGGRLIRITAGWKTQSTKGSFLYQHDIPFLQMVVRRSSVHYARGNNERKWRISKLPSIYHHFCMQGDTWNGRTMTHPITEAVRGYRQCRKISSADGNIFDSTFPIPEPPFLLSGPNPENWDCANLVMREEDNCEPVKLGRDEWQRHQK